MTLERSPVTYMETPSVVQFREISAVDALEKAISSRNLLWTAKVRTPKTPSRRNGKSSYECQSCYIDADQVYLDSAGIIILALSYVTWNKTSFPVPKGSRTFKVIAAIIAQKKLRHIT
jgi:hypothetical protein